MNGYLFFLRKLRKKAALEKEPTKILERTIVHIRVGGTIRVKKADTITPIKNAIAALH